MPVLNHGDRAEFGMDFSLQASVELCAKLSGRRSGHIGSGLTNCTPTMGDLPMVEDDWRATPMAAQRHQLQPEPGQVALRSGLVK